MHAPKIRVKRLSYVRMEAPDLRAAEAFLAEFGLQVAVRSEGAVHYRGTDPDPPCYVLTRGRGGFTTIAFEVEREADLETMARLEGASAIEPLDDPGGGRVVRLRDPQGTALELVYGRRALPPLPPSPAVPSNMDGRRGRMGALPGLEFGPSLVRRIGHLVLESADPDTVCAWYQQHLGLRISDAIRLPGGDAQMVFTRLDRGADYVDHHVIGFQLAMDEGSRVQHVAFEVGNFDDLMSGHEHLKSKRRKHVWGVGRHRFGGQIFDYWKSPWGPIHEHWTDTDLLNADQAPAEWGVSDVRDYWGPAPTPAFVVSRWNWKAVKNVLRLLRAR